MKQCEEGHLAQGLDADYLLEKAVSVVTVILVLSFWTLTASPSTPAQWQCASLCCNHHFNRIQHRDCTGCHTRDVP